MSESCQCPGQSPASASAVPGLVTLAWPRAGVMRNVEERGRGNIRIIVLFDAGQQHLKARALGSVPVTASSRSRCKPMHPRLGLLGLLICAVRTEAAVSPEISKANAAFGVFPTFGKALRELRNSKCLKPSIPICDICCRLSASFLSSWLRFFPNPFGVQPVQKEDFFHNRESEIRILTELLYERPKFTVLLGPPSTGKTRLADHVTRSVKTDGTRSFHVLHLNLRGVAIGTGQAFWRYVEELSLSASAFDKAWTSFSSAASKIKTVKIAAAAEVGFQDHKSEKAANSHFGLVESIPAWDGPPICPFVLVVDEANALKTLASGDYPVSSYFFLKTAL